ncbi:MAG TPA: DUF296 domain-containing protein [Candidatus Bathyarchaeia archaeon]|nr:DUF296 domain-containing protein [Candidatus Bathyarchaeia archaeon]
MEYVESKVGKMVFARLSENEDLLGTIIQVAVKAGVTSGFFMLIGTLKTARLGFFRKGKYETVEFRQPLEIVSCLGNVSAKEGKVFAHGHATVSDEKSRVFGGHVMPGCHIGVTGELVLVAASGIELFRKLDERTKLSFLSFSKSASEAKKRCSA